MSPEQKQISALHDEIKFRLEEIFGRNQAAFSLFILARERKPAVSVLSSADREATIALLGAVLAQMISGKEERF